MLEVTDTEPVLKVAEEQLWEGPWGGGGLRVQLRLTFGVQSRAGSSA